MNTEELIKLITLTVRETLNNAPQAGQKAQDRARIEHPGTYDGKAENMKTWILKMETYLTMCNTPKELWASHGYTSLTGLAYDFFTRALSSLPEDENIKCVSWNNFVTILKKQFEDPHSEEHYFNKLLELKTKSNIEDYIHEFQETASRIGNCPEKILVNLFTRGLNPECAKFTCLQQPSGLYDAIHIARTFTSITDKQWKNTTQRSNFNKFNHANQGFSKPFQTSRVVNQYEPMEIEEFQIHNRHRFRNQEKQRYLNNGLCFQCHKQGHIARNCPTNNRQFRRNVRPQINNIEYHYLEEPISNTRFKLPITVQKDKDQTEPMENNLLQDFPQSH